MQHLLLQISIALHILDLFILGGLDESLLGEHTFHFAVGFVDREEIGMKSKPRGCDCVVERVVGRIGTPLQVGVKQTGVNGGTIGREWKRMGVRCDGIVNCALFHSCLFLCVSVSYHHSYLLFPFDPTHPNNSISHSFSRFLTIYSNYSTMEPRNSLYLFPLMHSQDDRHGRGDEGCAHSSRVA